jgi:ORF6N domain
MADFHEGRLIPGEIIQRRIYLIRGQKVMLDRDLATLYDVPTKAFNQAVRRNLDRFPEDFMFRLTEQELRENRSQLVTGSQIHRSLRNPPYAFTEHGIAMLSAVLRSDRAVQVSISIIRAFVRLRELLANNKDLAARVEKLESHQKEHRSIIAILAAEIDELKSLPEPKSKRVM